MPVAVACQSLRCASCCGVPVGCRNRRAGHAHPHGHKPTCAAVENTFVNNDGAGTLKLGQARGVALLAPAEAGLSVSEYAPNTVKKTVVGAGHADKSQMMHMIKMQLPSVVVNGHDAADALGIALCHAYQGNYNQRVKLALSRGKLQT